MGKARVGFSRNMARKIHRRIGVKGPPINVHEIARQENLEVMPIPGRSPKWSGHFYRGDGIIALNQEHHRNRQRFTVAHELGHYFLGHHGEEFQDDVSAFGAYETGELDDDELVIDIEREANEFASELLVPLKMVKRNYGDIPDAKVLAVRYEVSETAMWVSLLKHGLFK